MATPTTVQLNEYSTQCALAPISRPPGVYNVLTRVIADGVVSSLFVKHVDPGATLSIEYWEATTGHSDGEHVSLGSHPLVDDTTPLLYTNKKCFSKLHSNLRIEATVTGGNVTFGILQSANNISILDEFFANNNSIPVSLATLGTPYYLTGSANSIDSTKVEILGFTVPMGVTRNLTQVVGVACEEGIFSLEDVNSGEILSQMITTPSNSTIPFKFDPARSISPGAAVKLYFTANIDNGGTPVRGFIMANDVT